MHDLLRSLTKVAKNGVKRTLSRRIFSLQGSALKIDGTFARKGLLYVRVFEVLVPGKDQI
jgi:hypothetical protein